MKSKSNSKPKKTRAPKLNLSGMKFEDLVKAMLNAPPLPKARVKAVK